MSTGNGLEPPFVDVTQLLEASAAWDQVSEPVQEAFLSDSRLSQLRESKEDERVKQLQSSLF